MAGWPTPLGGLRLGDGFGAALADSCIARNTPKAAGSAATAGHIEPGPAPHTIRFRRSGAGAAGPGARSMDHLFRLARDGGTRQHEWVAASASALSL